MPSPKDAREALEMTLANYTKEQGLKERPSMKRTLKEDWMRWTASKKISLKKRPFDFMEELRNM